MGRKERRREQKSVKKKLGSKTVEKLISESNAQLINDAIQEDRKATVNIISRALIETLEDKKFRISEDRKNHILNEFSDKLLVIMEEVKHERLS